MNKEKCPCCSGKDYAECCEPVIKGSRKAATPAELMPLLRLCEGGN